MDDIEDILIKDNIKLIRKTNVGIYIEADENIKSKFKEKYFTLKDTDDIFSAQYRQKYILTTLLENKLAYTIQMFADELYYSKSTIVNDLTSIQKLLEDKKLILRRKQNKGLWIEGKEEDYRNALMELIYNTNQTDDSDLDAKNLDYRIDYVNYKNIKSMFPEIDILFIQGIVQKAEEKLEFYFTEQAFLNLIVHITIAIDRIRSKKYIENDVEFIENLKIKNGNEYNIANWIINQLKEKFKIDFPEKEVSYVAVHVLGGKIQENHENKDISLLESSSDEQIIRIAKNIMSLSSEILGADLTKDKNLLASLILHLKPTIIRLRYGLKLSNPMLETIKRDYASIFGAVWACSSIFERELGISINEDEVGYITLHIALAYERTKIKIKVIVVCSSGIGTSQFVALKLENTFKNIEVVKILPYNLLTEEMMEKAELIISTVKNLKSSEKVIYVSSFLSEVDLNNIHKAINNVKSPSSSKLKKKKKSLKENKTSILDEDLIFTDDNHQDYFEALNYYGSLMEQMGYAKEGFTQNVLDREKKGSTYLGKGLAIPHSEGRFVNDSKLCIVRFKKPIICNENEIKIIVLLCLNFKDIYETREFFKRIFSILENDNLINQLQVLEDKNKIIDILKEGVKPNE